MQIEPETGATRAFQPMTDEQFLSLGTDQFVYLKPAVVLALRGAQAFMIYSADGVPLEVADDFETAVTRVAENALRFVRVH